jgi:hypothetical protein
MLQAGLRDRGAVCKSKVIGKGPTFTLLEWPMHPTQQILAKPTTGEGRFRRHIAWGDPEARSPQSTANLEVFIHQKQNQSTPSTAESAA